MKEAADIIYPPLLVFYQYILILLAISAECERIVRLASMSASFMFGVINAYT